MQRISSLSSKLTLSCFFLSLLVVFLREKLADKHKVPAPACTTLSSALKGCVLRGDGVPSTPAKDLPLAYALHSGGSESNVALQLKVRPRKNTT